MKKILILSCISVLTLSSFLDARLKQNKKTGVYYTEGASRKLNKQIDKQEYHDLAEEYLEGHYPYIDEIFMELNLIGTPAALRLRDDLILWIQESRRDLQQMYQ
jgi:hypothetical protein